MCILADRGKGAYQGKWRFAARARQHFAMIADGGPHFVIPAEAGIQRAQHETIAKVRVNWLPAEAGMTNYKKAIAPPQSRHSIVATVCYRSDFKKVYLQRPASWRADVPGWNG